MSRNFALLIIAFSFNFASFSQEGWNKVNISTHRTIPLRKNIEPKQLYQVNLNKLTKALSVVPKRLSPKNGMIVSIPNTFGEFEKYRVYEYSNFSPALQEKYPDIKSYVGAGIDDPTAYLRLSIDSKQIQTMVLRADKASEFIEPYDKNKTVYAIFNTTERQEGEIPFECKTEGFSSFFSTANSRDSYSSAREYKTFRLALSCTGEYGQYHGGTVADALAAMNATMTRVNGVFEKDFSVHLIMIDNNSDIVYTDPNSDPYSSAGQMSNWNSELQANLTSVIGEENYDIGHLFGATGGGGNAGCIGCICEDGAKGSGYTSPADGIAQGDNFDIDYVAHEMGHQLGANHTFSYHIEGTGVNIEPGSGSTIMGYAGITNYDVQMHSDDYFAYRSILQVENNLATKTCAVTTAISNQLPTLNVGGSVTIPKGTAFVLEGSANDPENSNALTYCWEENDNATSSVTNAQSQCYATKPAGANFRSLLPISTGKRYFPKLSDVFAGNLYNTWESVLDIDRTLHFTMTVRDISETTESVTVTKSKEVVVSSTAGPFIVNSQSNPETWFSGSNQTITWDVANTDSSPVNTSTVDILLTTDNGNTLIELASNIPNNGSYDILVPLGIATSSGRIIVKGHDNVFFAVNSTNITIEELQFVMSFDNNNYDVCASNEIAIPFTYKTFNGFSETTTFTATGNPQGSSISFTPNQASNNNTDVIMNINNVTDAMIGEYVIHVTGTAFSTANNIDINVNIYKNEFSVINLINPSNGEQVVPIPTTIQWSTTDTNITNYYIEIATDSLFSNIIYTLTTENNTYNLEELIPSTTYYWHIKPNNICGEGDYSDTYNFTTSEILCKTIYSSDTPKDLTDITESIININDDLIISDINIQLNITHPSDENLDIFLISPDGTEVELTSGNGQSEDNYIDTLFDDDASIMISNASPPFTGDYQPESPLSAFNYFLSKGDWTLSIKDNLQESLGKLVDWSIGVCGKLHSNNDTKIVQVFSNPVIDILNVHTLGYNRIQIFDIYGKLLKTSSITDGLLKVDFTKYSNGLYFVSVYGNSNNKTVSKTFKVIKK